MEFEEENCRAVDVGVASYVYFLLQGKEVVYVGQTKNGLTRIYQHKDKVFDMAYVMECDANELNRLENRYIFKYRPKYNKRPNDFEAISLQRVKRLARSKAWKSKDEHPAITDLKIGRVDLRTVQRTIARLGIEVVEFDCINYISREDAHVVANEIVSGLCHEQNTLL